MGKEALMRQVAFLSLCLLGFLCAQSCSQEEQSPAPANNPRIRVLILENATVADLSSDTPVQIWQDPSSGPRVVRLTSSARLVRSGAGWALNSVPLGSGTLTIEATGDSMRVNGVAYRGFFRFFPLGAGNFQAVNDV